MHRFSDFHLPQLGRVGEETLDRDSCTSKWEPSEIVPMRWFFEVEKMEARESPSRPAVGDHPPGATGIASAFANWVTSRLSKPSMHQLASGGTLSCLTLPLQYLNWTERKPMADYRHAGRNALAADASR